MGRLFYGTQTGTTAGVAKEIQKHLRVLIDEVSCIQFAKPDDLKNCNFLILGGSTWGEGELTDDWLDFWPQMDAIDFSGKKVALFALGDQYSYGHNFVSAIKQLYDKVRQQGGQIIADRIPNDEFDFEHSESLVNDHFVGLVIDEVNQPELTEKRITYWANLVRTELLAALT